MRRKNKIFRKSFYFLIFGGTKRKPLVSFDGLKIHGLNCSTIYGLFGEIFVRNEYKFHTKKESPIILDLGANIGVATIYFKRLYPKSQVHAFEPDKKHFNIMQANMQTNRFSNVILEEKAVTDYNGEIVFYTDDKASFSMSTKKGRMQKIETKVQCTSINDVIGKREIDLLKMDIEGGEFDVLKALDSSGKINQIQEMIIEYHHNIKDDTMSFSEFLEILEKNGFTYGLNTSLFPLEAKNKFQDIFIHAYKD